MLSYIGSRLQSRLVLQGTQLGINPVNIPRAERGVPAGGCAGTAPSHFSRAKPGRTAPLPPSAAGGALAPPHWQPPPAAPICSPLLRLLQNEVPWP